MLLPNEKQLKRYSNWTLTNKRLFKEYEDETKECFTEINLKSISEINTTIEKKQNKDFPVVGVVSGLIFLTVLFFSRDILTKQQYAIANAIAIAYIIGSLIWYMMQERKIEADIEIIRKFGKSITISKFDREPHNAIAFANEIRKVVYHEEKDHTPTSPKIQEDTNKLQEQQPNA